MPRTLTTRRGAERLGGSVEGLIPWQTVELSAPTGGRAMVTAAPARHGPVGIEPVAGDVIGFLIGTEAPGDAVYVTGDTVWFEGVAEVARRYAPRLVVLFAGAARARGPFRLTMDSNEAVEVAHAFPAATLVAVHVDGWAHLTESRWDLSKAFSILGIGSRLIEPTPGQPLSIRI